MPWQVALHPWQVVLRALAGSAAFRGRWLCVPWLVALRAVAGGAAYRGR